MNDVPVNESLDGMFGKEIDRCHKQIEKAALNIAQNEAAMDILRDYEFTLKEMYKLYRANEVKAADVQPIKYGKWLSRCEGDIYAFSECSECGNTESCETPYCAQCGAKMDAEPDEPWQSD